MSEQNGKELQPHQDRVVIEAKELYAKLNDLNQFLSKEKPVFVNDEEWERLHLQAKAMTEYALILHVRIDNF